MTATRRWIQLVGPARSSRLVPFFLALVALLGLTVWGGDFLPTAFGKEQAASDTPDRTVLPPPDPEFKGKTARAQEDSMPDFPEALRAPRVAPNVLLVMGDDVGFGQPSTFGGPVHTPTLERLARQGLRYNHFHTNAVCAASRAALLTGRNAHSVGMGFIPETASGYPGYNAIIPKSAATVGEILRQNGYATAWFGKSHLTPVYEITPVGPFDRWPTSFGFDYFYGFFGAGANQWYTPIWENTSPVRPSKTPEEGYHFEADMADKAIRWIQQQHTVYPDKPWFAFWAPSAHKPPVAAPKSFIAKYKGKFDDGYDNLRKRTLARQIELGVVPPDTELSKWPEGILPHWDELTEVEKKIGARWMEVVSGSFEHTDFQAGRIIEAIEQLGNLDNTLIIYIPGDNGPTPEGGLQGSNNKSAFTNGVAYPLERMLEEIDELGGPRSSGSMPATWAYATSSPFMWGKPVASHLGGVRSGMVISWPARIKDHGGLRTQFHHLIDIVPTILEASRLPEPKMVKGIKQKPIEGVSMMYTFDDRDAPSRRTTQYFESLGTRAIYKDGWWAGTRHGFTGISLGSAGDFANDEWELYHLDNDYGQSKNLAATYPGKLEELKQLLDREAEKYQVYPLRDDLPALLAARQGPQLTNGNKVVYGLGIARMPEQGVIDIKNRSFSIVAEIETGEGMMEGVIVTLGGSPAGFVLMVQKGKPTFVYNWFSLERYTIASSEPLPMGKSTIRFDFLYDGGGRGKGGMGTMSVNGKQVARGRIDKTVPTLFTYDETLDVGEDWGSPVSWTYEPPFPFTGRIERVTIEVE